MRFRPTLAWNLSSEPKSLDSSIYPLVCLISAVNNFKLGIAKQNITRLHPNFYTHAKKSLLFLGLLLSAASIARAQACNNTTPSGTTITCVQSAWGYQNFSSATVTAGSTSTGSGAPTFSSSPVAGHVLAVFTASNLTFTSITDTCNTGGSSDTYTVKTGTSATVGYAVVGATGACHVTATYTGTSGRSVIMVEELSGVNTSTPVDPSTLATPNVQSVGTGTALTSASITTVVNGDYIFGATYDSSGNASTFTAGSGFSLDQYQNGLASYRSQTEYTGQASAGTMAATFGHNPFSTYETGIIAFRPQVGSSLWSGILNAASAACDTVAVSACAIDWSQAGIPGYNTTGVLPSSTWTQSGSTILASTYGNGASDAGPGIQTALNSCGTNHYVLLGVGTFLTSTQAITVPNGCVLRGSGANQTIIKEGLSHKVVIVVGGASGPGYAGSGNISVTSSPTASSTTLTVASGNIGSFAVGNLMVLSQLNSNHVTAAGSSGNCTWCDNGEGGTRVEQITLYISGVNTGTGTITFAPALPVSFTNTPVVEVWTPSKNAGVENLQVYATEASSLANFDIMSCYQCWVDGVEGNYADTDSVHVYVENSYQSQVTNSYFSNGYYHQPGTDVTVEIRGSSSLTLIQNNILERLHSGVMIETGTFGNVIGYNYMFGDFDTGAPSANFSAVDFHGANPMFTLIEGNIGALFGGDNIWGSATNNTYFRNWARGTDYACNSTAAGRNTVTCTPIGYPTQSGANGWIKYQTINTINPTFQMFNPNFVGDVVGSSESANVLDYRGNPLPYVNATWSICAGAGGTPCGTSSRGYGSAAWGFNWGYGEANDSGGTGANGQGCSGVTTYPCESQLPWSSALVHGVYDYGTNSTIWSGSLTHTLPASFYLTAKPSWWGSAPWPAIGPDVTSGTFVAGHANNNPAKNCYENTMGGSIGAGSPLSTFNATSCY